MSFITGKGKRKRTEPKDEAGREALAKRRRVDKEKQQKCRKKQANYIEEMEGEIQRLRAILENLGGSVE